MASGDIYLGGVLIGRVTEFQLSDRQVEDFGLMELTELPLSADEFVPTSFSCTFKAKRVPIEEGDDG